MKQFLFFFWGISLFCFDIKSEARCPLSQTINSNWTFNYLPSAKEDLSVASPLFNDNTWPAIALPHTWSTYETTKEIHPFIYAASERVDSYWWYGWGWYRKRLVLDNELDGKKIFIEFDGVQKYSKLFVNGSFVGEHKGGYTGFYFDITDYVRLGGENIIAVEVSNRRNDLFGTIPPSTAGNYNVYGGIYRDVRIVIKNPVFIPFQGSYKHEGGTFVTTPVVTKEEGIANVKTYVWNQSGRASDVTVKTTIKDAEENTMAVMESKQKIEINQLAVFEQESRPIQSPHLWSDQTPYLYSVHTEVFDGGLLVDTYQSPLGFRRFWWDYSDNSLWINDRKVRINGTNRHQEYPWLGDAIPKWLTVEDMKEIRETLAHNFIRTGNYPNDQILYDFCDSNGVIVVGEVPNIKDIKFSEEVKEQNLRELIRRNRNHPSIFFWCMGNETSSAVDSKYAIQEDTTRILHERKTRGYGDYVTHHATNLDLEHLLRVTIRGWYNKDVRDLEPEGIDIKARDGQMAGTEVYQHRMAQVQNGSIRGRIGKDSDVVHWLYADHGADRIYKDAPLKYVNAKGLVDLYRVPKYLYYLWQANYSEKPMLFIHPHYWRSQYIGQKKTIQVDSNCEEVELFVNGKSIAKDKPAMNNFFTLSFPDVWIEKGVIHATGYVGGKKAAEWSITMAGEPYKIVLTTDQKTVPADRSGLAIITADIVDKDGNHVYGAVNDLKWSVKGAGKLVGASVYKTDINKNQENEGEGYIDTPVKNVVRSTHVPGTITVKVSAQGLKGGVISIHSTPVGKSAGPVKEPVLSDRKRKGVERHSNYAQELSYEAELNTLVALQKFTAATEAEYRRQIKDFIVNKNPKAELASIEFETLLDKLASYLYAKDGELVEDDYNFIIRIYNDNRIIARAIDNHNLHSAFATSLREYYAKKYLLQNDLSDVNAELKFINSIPMQILACSVNPLAGNEEPVAILNNATGIYEIKANTLEQVLDALVNNNYTKVKSDEEFLNWVKSINPHMGERAIYDVGVIAIPYQYK